MRNHAKRVASISSSIQIRLDLLSDLRKMAK